MIYLGANNQGVQCAHMGEFPKFSYTLRTEVSSKLLCSLSIPKFFQQSFKAALHIRSCM